ncbi:hypothetical protein [Brucella pituitosa]|uniref:hypothetical protein n=1 Tax=Brucella pituitosa TaxID=571256 RepID=UPI003F4AC178
MKRYLLATLLLTQIAIIPQFAFAQNFPPHDIERSPPETRPAFEPANKPWMGEKPPLHPGLILASELNAVATFIGLESGQQEAWNVFTTSLIALREPPKPKDFSPAHIDVMGLLNQEADDAIRHGQDAVKFKNALAKLAATLRADQLEKLQTVLNPVPHLMPRPPFGFGPHIERDPIEASSEN